ncbi:MAG: DUF4956 domain-containing protein [Bacteroidota bacterium]|nr:DUF4956 domain-containing protein [Bacteroidota bacterium]
MINFIQTFLLDVELFNIDLIDVEDSLELVARFFFNTLIIVIIVRYIYYPISKRKDYLFTYTLIATVIFLLCFMLENVKLQLGFALGLFAIFGIIRYRTQQIKIKEMTYLFIVIGVSVINALANKKISYTELLFSNVAIITVTYLLEKRMLLRHESRKVIDYEKIDLIKPEKRKELLADLENRTGLKIKRIEIGKINFLRDIARIRLYYYEDEINYADDVDDYDNRDDDDD